MSQLTITSSGQRSKVVEKTKVVLGKDAIIMQLHQQIRKNAEEKRDLQHKLNLKSREVEMHKECSENLLIKRRLSPCCFDLVKDLCKKIFTPNKWLKEQYDRSIAFRKYQAEHPTTVIGSLHKKSDSDSSMISIDLGSENPIPLREDIVNTL